MVHQITLIEGDGIGPEVVQATKDVLIATGLKFEFDMQLLGLEAISRYNEVIPQATIDSIHRTRVALKGPTTTPIGSGHQSANVMLRKQLDLFSCIRPVRSVPGLTTRFSDVDVVVFRENTEGLYSGQEIEVHPGCVISLRTMTEKACSRIAYAAFSYARKHGRKRVCAVHKANILKKGDGLLLQCARSAREQFPEIEYDEIIIDAFCMKLVSDPTKFDVFFMENMFGDIVSDLCAGLIGGLGLLPGANIGDYYAVFEAVHGSAPDIAGYNIANPTALIQSAIMMLHHLGESEPALAIERALFHVLQEKDLKTRDLGGSLGTKQFAGEIIRRL